MDPYKPLTGRILLLALIILLLVMGSIYFWFSWATERAMIATFTDKAVAQSKLVSSALRQHVDQVFSDINMLAELPAVRTIGNQLTTYMDIPNAKKRDKLAVSEEEQQLYQYFRLYAERHLGTRYVYLATASGGYLVWPEGEVPASYDPRVRPWYKLGLSGQGSIQQTEPYVDLVDHRLIISSVRSFKDPDGATRGVVGIDTTMTHLLALGNSLDAVVLDEIMVIHPSGLILSDSKDGDREFEYVKQAAPALMPYLNRKDVFTFKESGETYYGKIETIPDLGWKIVVLSDRADLLAKTEMVMQKNMLSLSLFALILFMVLAGGIYQLFYNKSLQRLVLRRTVDLQETIDALIVKEQNLKKSEMRYMTLVNNIPGVVFRCEPVAPWHMQTITMGAIELTGYASEDFLGEEPTLFWDDLVYPEDRAEVNRVLAHEATREYELMYRILHRSGEIKWVYERGSIVMNDDGATFIDGIIFDVSERQRADAEIKRLYSEMEIRVEERTAALKNAMEQLIEQEKMASLGGIIAGVAHEINTPLGIGITAASFLKKNEEELYERFSSGKLTRSKMTELVHTIDESLELIQTNLDRAAELVNTFKLISVNQVTGERTNFSLKENLSTVLLTLKHEYRNRGYEIRVDCPETIVLFSYPGAYSQIFTVLLMNTFIHGFSGREKGEIIMKAAITEDERLILTYEDDGAGISEDHLSKIFEPFFTTNRSGGCSGLGLYIAYNIVTQKLGGTIRCQSIWGRGTRFVLDLPLVYEG